jgi:hypothetical protein
MRKIAVESTLVLLCTLVAASGITTLASLYVPFGTARDAPADPRRPMPAPATMNHYAEIRTGATVPAAAATIPGSA